MTRQLITAKNAFHAGDESVIFKIKNLESAFRLSFCKRQRALKSDRVPSGSRREKNLLGTSSDSSRKGLRKIRLFVYLMKMHPNRLRNLN